MAYVTGYTYTVLTNQSVTIAYVTACVRTRFNQSERDYSVRHGAYVRCFNQSEHGYSVRHGVYVTGCTYAFRPISARHSRILISAAPCGGLRNLAQPHTASRSLTQPHAASRSLTQPRAATVCTSWGIRTLFDQSEHGYGVRHGVYVTGCTYAFRFDQSGHDILMRVHPLNMCAPPSPP